MVSFFLSYWNSASKISMSSPWEEAFSLHKWTTWDSSCLYPSRTKVSHVIYLPDLWGDEFRYGLPYWEWEAWMAVELQPLTNREQSYGCNKPSGIRLFLDQSHDRLLHTRSHRYRYRNHLRIQYRDEKIVWIVLRITKTSSNDKKFW